MPACRLAASRRRRRRLVAVVVVVLAVAAAPKSKPYVGLGRPRRGREEVWVDLSTPPPLWRSSASPASATGSGSGRGSARTWDSPASPSAPTATRSPSSSRTKVRPCRPLTCACFSCAAYEIPDLNRVGVGGKSYSDVNLSQFRILGA